MAAFLNGLFKDPEKDRKQLVELLASYAQNVPELLPALRDVINYGILYDKKIEAFVVLLKQERNRQKRLSGGDGYETDYPENVDNVSVCSAETAVEPGSSVKKKKKKKKEKKQRQEDQNHSTTDVIDKTDIDHPENAENISLCEESPPVKKKKKKKHKKERTPDNDSLGSVESQSLQVNGYSSVSSGAGEVSAVDGVKPETEAKEEEDETSKKDRKSSLSALGAGFPPSPPFRVIPSIQLMQDPTRFPDLAPTPTEPAHPENSLAQKWRVTFEFDSLVAQSGRVTAADVCSILEQFGLKNIRVMQLAKSDVGSYSATVEFFSTDFLNATSQFSGLHSSIEGSPRIIGVHKITSGQSSPEGNNDSAAQTSSSVNLLPRGEDALEANVGELDSSNSGVVTASAKALTVPEQSAEMDTASLKLEATPQYSADCIEKRSNLKSSTRLELESRVENSPRGHPSTSADPMSPQSTKASLVPVTGSRHPHHDSEEIVHSGSRTSFQAMRDSASPHFGGPQARCNSGASHSAPKQELARRLRYLDKRLIQLLKDAGKKSRRACLLPFVVNKEMAYYLPVNEHGRFMRWMALQKEKILKNPSLISTHTLFRPTQFWFEEFRKFEIRAPENLPPMLRPKHHPRNGYGGSRGGGNWRPFRGRNKR